MGRPDEDLRNAGAPVGAGDHLGATLAIAGHVDFREHDALAPQQLLRRIAVEAIIPRIDHNGCCHVGSGVLLGVTLLYMSSRPASTTRANTRTSTCAAPARNRAREHPSMVAPEVSTSSTRTRRRPATAAREDSGTRKAPCTLTARSDADRPTCWAVDLTRLSAP